MIFYLIWIFLGRKFAERQGFGGLMSILKSRAKIYVERDTKTTFADVAGVEEAKFDLQEVVSFLKDPKSYGRIGAHLPKGALPERSSDSDSVIPAIAGNPPAGIRRRSAAAADYKRFILLAKD
jgi:cell division protease FtsH